MARKNFLSSILRSWKKSTTMEKVFYVSFTVVVVLVLYNITKPNVESFESSAEFIVKRGSEIYDDFYVNIYDNLLFNNIKNDYEIGKIMTTKPGPNSVILDIGSGTGHHVGQLKKLGYNASGIDISPSMVKKAKENYPDCNFKVADVSKNINFQPASLTHILCLYFTIYMIKDKRHFFNNCSSWLIPGGYLILHLVDRDKFDPILPVADVFGGVDPQQYAKKRITNTVASFDTHDYKANFDIKGDTAMFIETFKSKANGSVRKHEHKLFMQSQKEILAIAKDAGFILVSESEMKACKYNNQFIYILQKPQ
uniref:Methyltransferase type 11 domain-containing protein n=1 Tax=viral metagenome TaxID=1070528 RepID=A0A6C0CP97_9ZZZZ